MPTKKSTTKTGSAYESHSEQQINEIFNLLHLPLADAPTMGSVNLNTPQYVTWVSNSTNPPVRAA